jgi:hypothetical protein
MSTGAKVGIGVGVPVALIAFGLMGTFIFYRRRPRQEMNSQVNAVPNWTRSPSESNLPEVLNGPTLISARPFSHTQNSPSAHGELHVETIASRSQSPIGVGSTLPEVVQVENEEIRTLRAEYERIRARKGRLSELERLEGEEERLKQLLDARLLDLRR